MFFSIYSPSNNAQRKTLWKRAQLSQQRICLLRGRKKRQEKSKDVTEASRRRCRRLVNLFLHIFSCCNLLHFPRLSSLIYCLNDFSSLPKSTFSSPLLQCILTSLAFSITCQVNMTRTLSQILLSGFEFKV